MKKIYFLSALLISSLSFGQVALPHHDALNYTVGQALQTQTGWTVLNTGDDLAITAGNLSYPGMPASAGNKIAFGGAGIDAGKDFTSQTTGTVYYSLLLNVTDLTATTSVTGGYCAGLVQGTSSSFGATLWLKKIDANTFNIGINTRTTAANSVYSPSAYNINQTYLIVASYTFNGSAADDVVNLWVNPVLGGAEPTALATATNAGGTDLTSAARFLVRQGSATDTPNIELDEFRFATTWSDVTSVTLGVAENNISGLKVYPNPAKTNLFVTSDNFEAKKVEIYNVLGKSVLSATVTNAPVNVSALTTGVYMVKVTEEGKTATRKLVIE
ncbi:T9SS type A sorting domain-containing protein [Flavobacterium sp.]|uniref:T9SS type A sorting domain-containing protein n=1 Tax=Flavobacterium sp. TaxID=239 RepID=UPI003D6A792A